MNAITPFIFEDNLVRSIIRGEEPWFVGNDVCRALAIKNPRDAMERLDEDERGVANTDTLGGEQSMIIVSEAGVFRLIFTSRKEEAERFKRWLAHEVLPKLRRDGKYAMPNADAPSDFMGQPFEITSEAAKIWDIKLATVREARHLWGHERARAIWRQLGLAVPPETLVGGQDEARDCLATLLAGYVGGASIRELLMKAMDGDADTAHMLHAHGFWVEDEQDGFVVANRNPTLERMMQGTRWANASWRYTLRRLAGATGSKAYRFEPGMVMRGTFLPSRVLDLFAEG
jgi:prophage antirepressor-like protein